MTAGRSQIKSWNCIPRLFLHIRSEIMANDKIEYTTVEQQIEKLKQQNLIISDEEFAKDMLTLCGYSNLIKSYREPYVVITNGKKIYRSGVTFDQIYSLYSFDKNLRNAVMAAMLDLEEHIKEAAADTIAQSFGVHQDDYLKYSNYQNRRKRKERFSLPNILDILKNTLDTGKNPIYHYKTEHGIVPPWILFKSVFFTTIVNFIDLFKSREQEMMVKRLYNSELSLSIDSLKKLMMDTLFICIEYRNAAAHGGRIYNYVCKSTLRSNEIFGHQVQGNIGGFSQLLFLLNLFKYLRPYNYLSHILEVQVSKHCSCFPQDITYLGQVLNMNIIPKDTVFVSEKSHKYHKNPNCSGIQNVREMPLNDANEAGYLPCKRCCR